MTPSLAGHNVLLLANDVEVHVSIKPRNIPDFLTPVRIGCADGWHRCGQYYIELTGASGLEYKKWLPEPCRTGGEWLRVSAPRSVDMGITVIFSNGDERIVPSYMLDYLIREKKIVAFLRATGWVQVDRDPIRKTQQPLTKPGDRWNDFMFKRPHQ